MEPAASPVMAAAAAAQPTVIPQHDYRKMSPHQLLPVLLQAISQMEEKGMHGDPRYNSLVNMANRVKSQMHNNTGSSGSPNRPPSGPPQQHQSSSMNFPQYPQSPQLPYGAGAASGPDGQFSHSSAGAYQGPPTNERPEMYGERPQVKILFIIFRGFLAFSTGLIFLF